MKKITKKLHAPLIIWIYSGQDTGKTTLMRNMVDALYPFCQKFVVHRNAISNVSDEEGSCLFRDHKLVFATDGDTPKQVAHHINKFYRLKPDVVLLTARKDFEQWKKKLRVYLKPNAAAWLESCDVIELPRLIVGRRMLGTSMDEMFLGIDSDSLFLFLTRMLKNGLPRKWPAGRRQLLLAGYEWKV